MKTTYVIRDGRLVEKPGLQQGLTILPLPSPGTFSAALILEEWRREVDRAFGVSPKRSPAARG